MKKPRVDVASAVIGEPDDELENLKQRWSQLSPTAKTRMLDGIREAFAGVASSFTHRPFPHTAVGSIDDYAQDSRSSEDFSNVRA